MAFLEYFDVVVKKRTGRIFNRVYWQNRIVFSIFKGMVKLIPDSLSSFGKFSESLVIICFNVVEDPNALHDLNDNELSWANPFSDTEWFYRPCSSTQFKCGPHQNVALCQRDDNVNLHSAGTYDSRKESILDSSKDGLVISYSDGDIGCGGITRSSTVHCLCDVNELGILEDVVEVSACTFKFVLKSKDCCSVPKPPDPEEPEGGRFLKTYGLYLSLGYFLFLSPFSYSSSRNNASRK
ncbi:hypothetical protein P9112_005102 [Eukaryota sp. TZLM1-RC]